MGPDLPADKANGQGRLRILWIVNKAKEVNQVPALIIHPKAKEMAFTATLCAAVQDRGILRAC